MTSYVWTTISKFYVKTSCRFKAKKKKIFVFVSRLSCLSPHPTLLYQQWHNMLNYNYYWVGHCIIQLLSVWMSQDMPTPLFFLSVFLFFSSSLSHLIMILFCMNNGFLFYSFLAIWGVSLCLTLPPSTSPSLHHLISPPSTVCHVLSLQQLLCLLCQSGRIFF